MDMTYMILHKKGGDGKRRKETNFREYLFKKVILKVLNG